MKIALSFLAAVLVPTFPLTVWYLADQFARFQYDDPYIWERTGIFLVPCLIVTLVLVTILGVPAFFLLRSVSTIRLWNTVTTGFVLAAVMIVLLMPPSQTRAMQSIVDGSKYVVHGPLTVAEWWEFASRVLVVGSLGAASALGFWLVWRIGNPVSPTGDLR